MGERQNGKIYLILVAVMVIWGFNVTALKLLVSAFPPVTITSLRIMTAGVSVFITLGLMRKLRIPTRNELLYTFAASIFNVVFHHYFLSVGLTKTTASNAGLILGLGPLLSAILAAIFLGSSFNLLRIIGIFSGLTGVSFVVLANRSGIGTVSIGDIFVFVSIFLQAFSFIMIKKASRTMDPRLMTGYMMVFGAVILFIISLFQEPGGLTRLGGSGWIWLIFLGSAVIATGLGHMMYNYAIGRVGVAEAAIFINLNPFFALIAAYLFLNERITASHLAGFIFILIGVLFGSGALEEIILSRKKSRGKA